MIRLLIDPGHGGTDPGAVAHGLREKDVCLEISLMLHNILIKEYTGVLVKLSRATDRTLSLKERTDLANKWRADLLLSIHVNAGGGTGFESFIYHGKFANKEQTDRWRGLIHDEIVRKTAYRDRGKKEANFHMLRESRMAAVLTENGFIDTVSDARQLKKEKFLWEIANAHAVGVAKVFGLRGNHVGRNHSQDNKNKYHFIQKGDTLWSLAKRYDTTIQQLLQWNEPIIPEHLQIGRKIKVG